MGAILAKLAAFTAGRAAWIWTGVGILAIVGGMYARIQYLEYERDKLDVVVAGQLLDIQLARQANTVNTVAITELVGKLNECREKNRVLEQNSQQAVTSFRKKVEEIQQKVDRETLRVRQALQNETCAMVAVPGDVVEALESGSDAS